MTSYVGVADAPHAGSRSTTTAADCTEWLIGLRASVRGRSLRRFDYCFRRIMLVEKMFRSIRGYSLLSMNHEVEIGG
jgi:hypothetical protein